MKARPVGPNGGIRSAHGKTVPDCGEVIDRSDYEGGIFILLYDTTRGFHEAKISVTKRIALQACMPWARHKAKYDVMQVV